MANKLNENKTHKILEDCCSKVYYDMESLGLKPGSEDWVRNPECICKLENLIKDVWIEECGGDPAEWPWKQSYILLTFIRERKSTRKKKDITKGNLEAGTLFSMPGGTIYFIKNTRGHIKIGWTGGDPFRRLNELQTGESEPLNLFAKMSGSERQEKAIHVRFASHKTGGGTEWFHPTHRIRTFITENAECL